MTPPRVERAAGGLVWRTGRGGVELLQVHRPKYGDWTFPKGKIEESESLVECARREVLEEAGVHPRIGRYLGELSYYTRYGRPKEVHYWAMRAGRVAFQPSGEVDRIRWVPERSLNNWISYETERELVARLEEGWRAPADRILLTRHAHAGARGAGPGDDSARPLSERGNGQARAIVEQLRGFRIDTILTSRATRCQETVKPLAVSRDMVPEISEELWEEAGAPEVSRLLANRAAGTSLLCSHRPNVLAILRMLTGREAPRLPSKGSTWILDFAGQELCAANYLAAPAQDA